MPNAYFDYQFGISEIIPSGNRKHGKNAKAFLGVIKQALSDVNQSKIFPTKELVLIFILQFFAEEKEYKMRDVDNMCKVMLDSLNGRLFDDDSQVKTLLISKQLDKRIPADFIYIGMKIVSMKDDTGMVAANKKDAVRMYQEAKLS